MSSARGTIPFLIGAAFIFAMVNYTFNAARAQKLLQSSPTSTVEFVKVHGKGLEGNLEGDSPDRDVAVLLPPSYATAKNRRYPVLYMLHGFTDKMGKWFGQEKFWINLPEVVDRANAAGIVEMIVVMPDAYTRYEGSMYSTSVTTGDWESYIATELVTYVDTHYRTLARAESRGIAGHSLGGYGALRIGIRHPDVFSATYAMSPCCLTPGFAVPPDAASASGIEAVKTFEDLAKADIGTRATFASAAAWSPNPKNPPFFIDLPLHNGVQQPMVIAKWTANRPLFMVDQNIWNLRKLHGIGFDGGSHDIPENVAGIHILHGELDAYEISHEFDLYDGDHTSGVAARLENVVMPFFARKLDAGSQQAKH